MTDELVAAIEANPDDVESYRVLADVLQASGDQRGALIAMQVARETEAIPIKARILDEQIAKHFIDHDDSLLGELRPWAKGWRWRRGFLHALQVSGYINDPPNVRDVLQAVLAHPSAHFLRELSLQIKVNPQHVIDTLVAFAPKSLRSLDIGIHEGPVDLSAVWPRLPQLAKLVLGGVETLGTDELPNVREAKLYYKAVKTAHARWPALEKLVLSVSHFEPHQEAVMAVLDNPHLPRLTRLHLSGSGYTNDLVARLSSTVVGRQLVELDLDYGFLDDAGVSGWLAAPPARKLAVLSVVGNRVSKPGRASLYAIADRVIGRRKDR